MDTPINKVLLEPSADGTRIRSNGSNANVEIVTGSGTDGRIRSGHSNRIVYNNTGGALITPSGVSAVTWSDSGVAISAISNPGFSLTNDSITLTPTTSYYNTALFRALYTASTNQTVSETTPTDVTFDTANIAATDNISLVSNSQFKNVSGRTVTVHVSAYAAPTAPSPNGTVYDCAIRHYNSSGTLLARYGRSNGYVPATTGYVSFTCASTVRMAANEYITFNIWADLATGSNFQLTSGTAIPGGDGRMFVVQQIG